MRKILILGAGWEQAPIIKKAKELGLFVIATNSIPNCEGSRIADLTFVVDPLNFLELDRIFQEYNPEAVISDACDYSMLATSFLSQRYALPGPKYDTALICNNKYLQREKVHKNILFRQPKFKLCATYDDLLEFVYENGLPIVVKPINGRGGIGITFVGEGRQLNTAYFGAMANSTSRYVLAEEYITGNVIAVEGIFLDKHYTLSYATKVMHPIWSGNAMHLDYPGLLNPELSEHLIHINDKLVLQLSIRSGMTHIEYIIKDGELYFIEAHNRGSGVLIGNTLIPEITGIDTPELIIRQALGERNLSIDEMPISQRHGALHFFDVIPGYVDSIAGYDKISPMEGVLNFRLNIEVGSKVLPPKTALERPGFVLTISKNYDDSKKLINKIENTLKIVTKPKRQIWSAMAKK